MLLNPHPSRKNSRNHSWRKIKGGSRPLTPEEKKQAEEFDKLVNQEVEQYLANKPKSTGMTTELY